MNHSMFQLLSGHGDFNVYLHKINKSETENCDTCQETLEDPQHVALVCPRYENMRVDLRQVTEQMQIRWPANLDTLINEETYKSLNVLYNQITVQRRQ